jgi:hypothetical protein
VELSREDDRSGEVERPDDDERSEEEPPLFFRPEAPLDAADPPSCFLDVPDPLSCPLDDVESDSEDLAWVVDASAPSLPESVEALDPSADDDDLDDE